MNSISGLRLNVRKLALVNCKDKSREKVISGALSMAQTLLDAHAPSYCVLERQLCSSGSLQAILWALYGFNKGNGLNCIVSAPASHLRYWNVGDIKLYAQRKKSAVNVAASLLNDNEHSLYFQSLKKKDDVADALVIAATEALMLSKKQNFEKEIRVVGFDIGIVNLGVAVVSVEKVGEQKVEIPAFPLELGSWTTAQV